MNLQAIRTKTGKSIQDFTIPVNLMEQNPEMVEMILRSEAMDDAERQYWFNLTDVMTQEQIVKLKGILIREKERLEAIYDKYGKKRPIHPEEAKELSQESASKRKKTQATLKAQEAMAEAQEKAKEEGILSEDAWE